MTGIKGMSWGFKKDGSPSNKSKKVWSSGSARGKSKNTSGKGAGSRSQGLSIGASQRKPGKQAIYSRGKEMGYNSTKKKELTGLVKSGRKSRRGK